MLLRLKDGEIVEDRANAPFVTLGDDEPAPAHGGVIVSLTRYRLEGDALGQGERGPGERSVGVQLASDQSLEFPKFRDGRAFTSASLLRDRFGYRSEIRAVGEVLREQAFFMVRCGFDAFEPSDGSSAQAFARSAFRYRHVYQAGADDRPAAFVERERQTDYQTGQEA